VPLQPQGALDGLANGGLVVHNEDSHRGRACASNLRGS
jgi:hypothetical protein